MNPFEIFTAIPSEIIYRPIFNALALFLRLFNSSLGFAIIGLTVFIRILLIKSTQASNQLQGHMSKLQPRMKEIQEEYGDNPQKMAEETMKLFRGETGGSNPLKGCLMMLIQIPITLGLFLVVNAFATGKVDLGSAYSFLIPLLGDAIQADAIKNSFYGIDLYSQGGTIGLILAIIGALLLFMQLKLTQFVRPTKKNSQLEAMQALNPNIPNIDPSKIMGFFSIFIAASIAIFILSTPLGVGFYVITSTLFAFGQFLYQYRTLLWIEMKALLNSGTSKKNKSSGGKGVNDTVIDISDKS